MLALIDSAGCNAAALTADLGALLAAERTIVDALMASSGETQFRSVQVGLGAEEELFEPVVRCGLRDQTALRTTVERVLLRREMWRYRAVLLQAARAAAEGGPLWREQLSESSLEDRSTVPIPPPPPEPHAFEDSRPEEPVVDPALDDPPGGVPEGQIPDGLPRDPVKPTPGQTRRRIASIVESLVELRKLRAQLRLRVPDDALRAELLTVEIPDMLAPMDNEPEMAALIQTEVAIDSIERELAWECIPAGSGRLEELWPRLLRALGRDSALVGYLPVNAEGGRRVSAFVVDGRGEVTWTDLGDEESLSRRLDAAWIAVAGMRTKVAMERLRQAGKDLYDPVAARLAGKRSIRILGSSVVRFLPWTSFLDEGGKALGDQFAVSWLQSVADAEAKSGAAAGRAREAVLVTPHYETTDERRHVLKPSQRLVQGGFQPLAGALEELAAVRGILASRGMAVRPIVGDDATEAALRGALRQPSILHVAAHGFSVPSADDLVGGEGVASIHSTLYWPSRMDGLLEPNFIRTGIALAGANRGGTLREDDGLLTASEAADLDLRGTSLVVLSGCATASPQLHDVGGAYDLSLGFRMAGAEVVIASLWEIDDRATRLLMTELYRQLAAGKPVAAALRHAKNALRARREFASPLYWTAFEIFGNGDATLF
jgi:CHAT domain-containing protein